jgi:hypothetical protein
MSEANPLTGYKALRFGHSSMRVHPRLPHETLLIIFIVSESVVDFRKSYLTYAEFCAR